MAMKTQSEFYKKKQENERLLMETEFHLKNGIDNILNHKKKEIKSIISLPFQTNSKIEETRVVSENQHSDSILQNGIQLYHSIKQVSQLSKQIIQQFKS